MTRHDGPLSVRRAYTPAELPAWRRAPGFQICAGIAPRRSARLASGCARPRASTMRADAAVDAVVVGAGPAGAATAILLAEEGARVLLLDRARFPRDKVCGEYLSPEAEPDPRPAGRARERSRPRFPICAACASWRRTAPSWSATIPRTGPWRGYRDARPRGAPAGAGRRARRAGARARASRSARDSAWSTSPRGRPHRRRRHGARRSRGGRRPSASRRGSSSPPTAARRSSRSRLGLRRPHRWLRRLALVPTSRARAATPSAARSSSPRRPTRS